MWLWVFFLVVCHFLLYIVWGFVIRQVQIQISDFPGELNLLLFFLYYEEIFFLSSNAFDLSMHFGLVLLGCTYILLHWINVPFCFWRHLPLLWSSELYFPAFLTFNDSGLSSANEDNHTSLETGWGAATNPPWESPSVAFLKTYFLRKQLADLCSLIFSTQPFQRCVSF